MQFQKFLQKYSKITILTGAGISTGSGIPDYRGPNGIYTRQKDYKPIQYQEFTRHHSFRQRYWARSFIGYPRISKALPNNTHLGIANLTRLFNVQLITQNVDGLHHKAGSKALELHGTLAKVKCINCHTISTREKLQNDLAKLNPNVLPIFDPNVDVSSSVNPDGDSDYKLDYDEFKYPECSNCGGILKPDVVFFGENLSDKVRDESFRMVDKSEALIVIGSSLTVYSALRLVKRAHSQGIDIGIINLGPTRGDNIANYKWNESSDDILSTFL